MKSDDIRIFSDLLSDADYCLLYNGNFIDAVTSKIINITKVSLIQRGELIKTQNRFAYLIAESFQNIIRHGGHKEHKIYEAPLPGFFMAKINGGYYELVSGNLIENANIPPLKTQYDHVNALSEVELKNLYNKTLAEGELSAKGGAGLGLIDMAKKTAQKLEYKFLDATAQKSLFYHRLVMTSGEVENGLNGSIRNIEFGIKMHNAMIDRNILVLQKSDFSRDSVLPMLNIVEENVLSASKNSPLIKVIYKILIELIHNINHNNFKCQNKKEGLFLIAKNDDSYNICSSYYIDNKKVNELKQFIDEVVHMNAEELESTHFQRLQNDEFSTYRDESNQMFDIKKIIAERFSFSFYGADDEVSFFCIYALV